VEKGFFKNFAVPGTILGWKKAQDSKYGLFNVRKYLNEKIRGVKEKDEEDEEDSSSTSDEEPPLSSKFTLYLFNFDSMKIEGEYSGHIANSPSSGPFIVWPELSFDDCILFTGSEDGKIFIFHKDQSEAIASWQAHDNLVNEIAYHPSKQLLLTCSDDFSIKIWRPTYCKNDFI